MASSIYSCTNALGRDLARSGRWRHCLDGGAYDGDSVYRALADRAPTAEVIILPQATARPSTHGDQAPTQRYRHLQMIKHRGRLGWQRATGYGRRSLVKTAMFRYKTLIGRCLRA